VFGGKSGLLVKITVDGFGEPFKAIQVVIYLLNLFGIDVTVAMGENVTQASDIDELLAV
jgi:hypothetical protein